jgi:hypothetical protein
MHEMDRLSIDEGTAAHELIHLLAANSGLQKSHETFPIWLQEGLAAQFEVFRGGRWAGVSRPHDLRLPDWRKIQPRPRLEPLVQDKGFGRGYSRDHYAQAWALVYFLRSEHENQFVTYLDLLRSRDLAKSDRSTMPQDVDLFARVFGANIEAKEEEWQRYMSQVRTPLEEHRREVKASSRTKPTRQSIKALPRD